MLLWQVNVAINPHVFVIATSVWSVSIKYLLVNCNKQLWTSTFTDDSLHSFDTLLFSTLYVWNGMCKDKLDVVFCTLYNQVAYYNLPRGKWSALIE